MHRLHRSIVGAVLYCLLSGHAIADISAEQDADIQYLFKFVAASGCTFIRNGGDNDPEAAADHLRLKYRRGKRYVSSAEQFIDRLASESSWTGKKYTINCEGEVSESGVWLHQALAEHRQQQN
jgi:hypothetical protein